VSVVLHHSFQSLVQPTSSQTPEFITNDDKNAVGNSSKKLVLGSENTFLIHKKQAQVTLEFHAKF
jgi:hypothetical protein